MIDYFALALGHTLLALAFLRLVVRDSLDVDPAITALEDEANAKKRSTSRRGTKSGPRADRAVRHARSGPDAERDDATDDKTSSDTGRAS